MKLLKQKNSCYFCWIWKLWFDYSIGFLPKDSLIKAAQKNPKQKFAIIDEIVNDVENIISVTFNEEEESFLAGIAAGLLTKTGNVGFIDGVEAPVIVKYESGFEQGVKYIKPDVKVLISYIGGYNAFNDPNQAEKIADNLIKKNADIFYHASGASSKGIIILLKNMGNML